MDSQHPWFLQLKNVTTLTDSERIYIFLSANCASGNVEAIARDWTYLNEKDHSIGLEVLIQNIGEGFAKVSNAIGTVAKVWIKGNSFALEHGPTSSQDTLNYKQRSDNTTQLLYPTFRESYRSRLASIHPVLADWINEIDFGRIKSRETPLSQKLRQLCTISSQSQHPTPALYTCLILGALNVGATVEEINFVIETAGLAWGQPSQQLATTIWADMQSKRANPDTKPESFPDLIKKDYQPMDPVLRQTEIDGILRQFPQVPSLPDWFRLCCLLAGHIAAGSSSKVIKIWSLLPEDKHRIGLEVILQAVTSIGWNNLKVLESIWKEVGISSTALGELKEEQERVATEFQMRKDGDKLFQQIYGAHAPLLAEQVKKFIPDYENILMEFIFGRVISRVCPGLELFHRELLVVTGLTGPVIYPQLQGHIMGALNCGATLEQLKGVLDLTVEVWGKDQQVLIDKYWEDFLSKMNKV